METRTDRTTWPRRLAPRVVVAMALVAAADVLFVPRGIGASAAVFASWSPRP